MIIQIYDVNNPEEGKQLVGLGVNHIGVLIDKKGLSFNQAREIFNSLPQGVKGVALSLSNNLEEIYRLIEKVKPDILHLSASPEDIYPEDILRIKAQFPNLKIMRTIPVIDNNSINVAKSYENIVDYLVLDTKRNKDSQIGATGETHNWNISKEIVKSVKIPVILAGGLGPDNIEEAIKKVKPAGVDSKAKTDRIDGNGKDFKKVREFVKIAKSF